MKFISAASVLLYAVVVAAGSNVIDLTPKNFDEIITNSGKPALIKFFAPWCGHCKKMAPTYDELGDAFASVKDQVVIAKVDADKHRELGKRFDIKGFPTLKWFDGKSETPITYDSARTLEAMTKYITDKTGIKLKGAGGAKKEPESPVKVLTDANFEAVANDPSKGVFVKFYAPWCGYCKMLAPIYEKLATTFARDSAVVIAEVNCDELSAKTACIKYKIESYPTLKYFPAGESSEPIPHDGGRELESLVEYINSQTGLNRLPGGGLNGKAGRIEALDEIIRAKLPKGLVGVHDELVEKVKGLEHKYAAYYVKVAKKLEEKKEYAKNELERLTKMVSKGGLHVDKVDDITQRQNILKSFNGDADEVVAEKKDGEKDEL
ncbi:hypothetical protein TWF481_001036 [Arthrobotrys musiformis]|uniref:protein disulfide-isomerase n=1 Tax=Arthrobotrys musiformis TaxID=47236 RepID=A0AAV9WPE0_9PEZI